MPNIIRVGGSTGDLTELTVGGASGGNGYRSSCSKTLPTGYDAHIVTGFAGSCRDRRSYTYGLNLSLSGGTKIGLTTVQLNDQYNSDTGYESVTSTWLVLGGAGKTATITCSNHESAWNTGIIVAGIKFAE